MYRLTKRVHPGMGPGVGLGTAVIADGGVLARMIDRLAAYEDTGLSPEEVSRLKVERDALMADLQATKPCGYCKHQNTDGCVLEDCLSACGEFIEGGIWEWCGLEGRA